MDEEKILEKTISVIAERLGISRDGITPNSSLTNDLGADSLDQTEIVMALEDEFDIEILDDDIVKLNKISDAVYYVKNGLEKRMN